MSYNSPVIVRKVTTQLLALGICTVVIFLKDYFY